MLQLWLLASPLASLPIVLITVILFFVAKHLRVHGHVVYPCSLPLALNKIFFTAAAVALARR